MLTHLPPYKRYLLTRITEVIREPITVAMIIRYTRAISACNQ